MEKFSKTISLSPTAWSRLVQLRVKMKVVDIHQALEQIINDRWDTICIVDRLEEAGLNTDVESDLPPSRRSKTKKE